MNRLNFQRIFAAGVAALVVAPSPVLACAVCQGETGSPLSEGLKWGVLVLLFVVMSVLAGITAFFVYLMKRSANRPGSSLASGVLPATATNT
ncbi:MAG: hypothetical protein HZA89_07480 [Verrucomicrobia bacterium]|nr:hypothetical protein [Verrucomicrobiota bacterium]